MAKVSQGQDSCGSHSRARWQRFPYEGELDHYFRHSEFGPPSAQLEILGGSTSAEMESLFNMHGEVSSSRKPRWPVGAIHPIMIRVFERLTLAEGHLLLGHALPPGKSFGGHYGRFGVKRTMHRFSWGGHLARSEDRLDSPSPGAWLTLWAYYGPFGKGRRYAEGNAFENTKDGGQECEDPIVALWPLIGAIQRETTDDDLKTLWDPKISTEDKRRRKQGHAEGIREAIDRARRDIKGDRKREINAEAEALLSLARGAYIEAARLHDEIQFAEVTGGL